MPVVAPRGTRVVIVVAVAADIVAATPLNVSTLLAGVVLKFVPVIVTVAPIAADAGFRSVMVGVGNTLKLATLVTVTPLTVTEIGPVVAPAGTVVSRLLVLASVTTAAIPLNLTTLFAATGLKFVPEIVTVAPGAPLAGLKLVKVGEGKTVKLVELINVKPLTVTEMGPVPAPTSTFAVILVVVDAVTSAVVLLNLTT